MENDYGFTQEQTERLWKKWGHTVTEAARDEGIRITRRDRSDYNAHDCKRLAKHLYKTGFQTRTVQQLVDELGWPRQKVEGALEGVDFVNVKYTNENGQDRAIIRAFEVYFVSETEHDSPVIIIIVSSFWRRIKEGTRIYFSWEEVFSEEVPL